jgi:pimeloyl-ACP methyl ester carboxylesterase
MQQNGYFGLPGNERLHYMEIGAGKKLLLAFHGYSNNATLFAGFERYLGNDYTIISFDLPYHGASSWNGRLLTIKDFKLILQSLLQQYKVNKASLMGYSLGGRVCLTIAEHIPEAVDKIILLSSDGMAFNPFYFFTTKTYLGKYLMRRLVANPRLYISVLDQLKRYKVVTGSLHTFVGSHLQAKKSREFLQNVWNVTSEIRPNTARLKNILNTREIPIFIYAGVYDSIIPVRLAKRFAKGIQTAQLTLLQTGHRTINAETMQAIAKNLSDK